jgi:photosystem II stability/assembly factor-like uncharacterized protein
MLFVATDQGLLILENGEQGWQKNGGALTGQTLTAIASAGSGILVGSRDGVYRSADHGRRWWESNKGLKNRHVRWLAYHPEDSSLAYAGTEPAGIFVSRDGGESWLLRPEVAALRDEHSWYLPYSPEAGCVRGFAFHGDRAYGAVEQGGFLRSDDRGLTWRLAGGSTGQPRKPLKEGFIHPDVHSVFVHPTSSDQVFAPTGGGLYYSVDGGRFWNSLHGDYCRAVWVDPDRPGRIILGTADGPDRNGRIEQSINGGDTWEREMASQGTVWPRHMVERFLQVGEELFAVLSNGELIAARLDNLEWRTVLPAGEDARAISAAN